jgi:hypothetical protein
MFNLAMLPGTNLPRDRDKSLDVESSAESDGSSDYDSDDSDDEYPGIKIAEEGPKNDEEGLEEIP